MKVLSLQTGFGVEISNLITLNIYFSGCKNNKKCKLKCHNLKDFNDGIPLEEIKDNIIKLLQDPLIEGVVLLGGEPLDQEKEALTSFIQYIYMFNKPIFIYSGYELDKIIEFFKKNNLILKFIKGIYYNPNHLEKNYISEEELCKLI